MNKKTLNYLIVGVLIFGGFFYLMRSHAHAYAYTISVEDEGIFAEYESYIRYSKRSRVFISKDDKRRWQEEYEFHMFHAKRTYEDAKLHCWYLPNVTDREKSRYCFNSAISTIGSSTPTGKLVTAIVSLMLQYGLDCMDEWEYIQNKLYWSEYHFDLCEHYQNMIHSKG